MKSDDSGGPEIPAGVLKTRAGWAGDELELEHRSQQLRDRPAGAQESAAVDLRQFQNTEVGKGYQAKHVIRQRSGQEAQVVHDMTQSKDKKRKKDTSDKPHRTKRPDEEPQEERDGDKRLKMYLQCAGLRDFRIEIERILKSEQ